MPTSHPQFKVPHWGVEDGYVLSFLMSKAVQVSEPSLEVICVLFSPCGTLRSTLLHAIIYRWGYTQPQGRKRRVTFTAQAWKDRHGFSEHSTRLSPVFGWVYKDGHFCQPTQNTGETLRFRNSEVEG